MNILKTIEKVRKDKAIPNPYQMDVKDMCVLISIAKERGIYEALIAAYRYGFVMGNHCTINRKTGKI